MEKQEWPGHVRRAKCSSEHFVSKRCCTLIDKDYFKSYNLEEAIKLATEILGYPCPCEQCSKDGGLEKSKEIMDLAYDLSGIKPLDRLL